MTEPLENLCGPGKALESEPCDENEYAGLLRSLPHTLGLGPGVWRVLSSCHDKRNLGECEGMLDINQRMVSDLIGAAHIVADTLENGRN